MVKYEHRQEENCLKLESLTLKEKSFEESNSAGQRRPKRSPIWSGSSFITLHFTGYNYSFYFKLIIVLTM